MKRVILTIFTGFLLSACGGGGGAAPDLSASQQPVRETVQDNSEIAITEEQRIEEQRIKIQARAEVEELQKSLGNTPAERELKAKLSKVKLDLDDARRAIGELLAEIKQLRADINTLKVAALLPSCGTNEEADGQSCICKTGYERINGNCVVPPSCGANEEAYGQICRCVSGYVRKDGVCADSAYNTPEYRRNRLLARANPLHAYNSGYFGQGVTVVVADDGFRVTHEDLADNIILEDTGLPGQESRVFPRLHGTGVAGILGAVQGNEKGSHGIAPSVKIIPLTYKVSELDHSLLWAYPAMNNHPIYHQSASYGERYARSIYIGYIPGIPGDDKYWIRRHDKLINYAHQLTGVIQNSAENLDTQYVWPAGNSAMNLNDIRPSNAMAYLPVIEKSLEDNIIIVVNLTDESPGPSTPIEDFRLIAAISDGCGIATLWCLAAYAGSGHSGHYTTGHLSDSHYIPNTNDPEGVGDTSGAAPVVSGALALLKSAAPMLPMTVIRQILLTTATDIGDPGIDELYGWGAVNVSAGIVSIEALETEGMNGNSGILLSDLRGSLPPEFAHLQGRLESVSVAVRITDNSFYNMPLSDIVGGGDSDFHRNGNMGNAAKAMQTDGFSAGERFRFWGGLDYDNSRSSYIGRGDSPFAAATAADTGGYVKWTTADYSGMSAFGEYGRTAINAEYGGNSLIAAVDNARAENWMAGIQYGDIWRHGDKVQFSARQESRISGGEMILQYAVAEGDSHKAFIGETPQTIRAESVRIPIKQKPQTIYTAGYSQQTDNGKWSAAAEWNAATNESAFSFAIELQIR